MFMLITPERYCHFQNQLNQMFALRYRVFCERLGWVAGREGLERDEFDDLGPAYIIYQDEGGAVLACVRLLPTTGKNMLRDTFPQLLDGKKPPEAQYIWESSRFAVDTDALRQKGKGALSRACSRLLLAMAEFGLKYNLKEIITVTDLPVERIARNSGLPLRRLGPPKKIGDTKAVAVTSEISQAVLQCVRKHAQVECPILFQSVI